MPEATVSVSTEHRGGVDVITVAGEVDAHTAPSVRAALDDAANQEREGGPTIVADLSGVTFLDSTGLAVFVTVLKRVRERDGSLNLVITSPRVMKVFTITGLDVLIPIHESVEAAIAS